MALTNTYNWNHNFPKLAHDTGFSFNTHKPRVVIDWNKIKLVDIEQLIRDRDFATVEDHFHDVVDCGLEWEFDVRILDSGVVKLFRLAQLAVEYQLYCRQYLDRSVAVLRDELSNTMQDLDKLKRELRTKEEEIKKLRRRSKGYKTMVPYVYGNENIANMILRTLSHGPDVIGPKPYSNQQQGYNKCLYCDKVFLNETYLKSHISRRHPEHANDSQQQMSPVGVEKSYGNINQSNERLNTKLYDEINELKQRLQDTERLLSRNSGTVNSNQINSNLNNNTSITKDDKTDNNNSPNEAQIKTMVLTPVDPNTVSEKEFEEWKTNEQQRFMVEIESLKKQLAENISALREKTIDSSVVSQDDQALQYLTSTLQKQEDEIKNLHQQLESKNAAVESTELQLKSQIDSQERTWRDRLSILEDKHASQVDQLTQRLEEVYRESVKVQQQRKSETTELDDLRRRMEERIAALEREKETRKVATAMSPEKKLLPKSNSIDSLPLYTASIIPTSTIQTKSSLQSTHNHLRRQAQRVLSKQLHYETTTLSESSDESLELDKTPIKMCRPVKSDGLNPENNSKSQENSKKRKKGNKENILPRQKWDKNEVPPVCKDITEQSESKSKDEIVSRKNKLKENIKRNAKSLPTTPEKSKIITKKRIKEKIGLLERGGKERRSKSEIDLKRLRERYRKDGKSDLFEWEMRNNLHRRRVSFDDMGYSIEQRQKRAEILDKVLSRLQTLGVDPKCPGLTKRELNAHQTKLQHSRSLQKKKNSDYAKTRTGILHTIDKEIRKKTRKSNEDVKEKIRESPTAKLVNRLSVVSMFSNVKNKAMSIVKTRSDKMKNERNRLGESVKEKNASLPNTPSGSETSSPLKKVLNRFSPKRKSEETIDSNRKILANSSSRKIVDESDENLSDQEISDSESSDTSVEKMTHLFNRNKKNSNAGYKVVTAAIAHEPSKSIESLIRSPIKVPTGKLNDVATSNKGKDFLRATSVQSLELDSSSRNAWSTRSEETETRVLESDSGDSESVMKARKFFSEENLIHSVGSPKGVLKNAPSNLSISSKKKVLFDLEATQMKSVSASPSQSTTELNRFSSQTILDAESENHWDVSSMDDIPIKEASKAPAEILKRSPKIAELTQKIELQLARRPENIQIAGAVQVMPQSDHKSHDLQDKGKEKSADDYGKDYLENYRDRDVGGNGLRTTSVLISGSNTSIGSSMLDDSNDIMNSPTTVPVPAPRYSANRSSGNVNKESDLEISDWSIEELLKAK